MIRPDAEKRRRAVQALVLWESLVLIGIGAVSILSIWHLRRRSRLIRSKFRPQRHLEDTFEESEPALSGLDEISRNEPRT
jgi:uncharacterized oligopeptide transporter (OPT) family protein